MEYFLVFEAIVGPSELSDIAIDDVSLLLGKECELTPPEAQPYVDYSMANCNFDKDGLCDWTSNDQGFD